ncbi:MAG: hypothetical protein Unbinned8596contig1000_22 [Prokaryotic dsDNA virus sp.]|nr:MAG: hypothetical protein Unbinned8596contig1000_22 [Prokaryotic dsDNA virus sp.]|tara:strand:- start:9149 stop:9598 length:450 start_codon:yes stop_codon:yes gene_type:complete
MNKRQLLDLVVKPTLEEIPNGPSGETAIMMIIAHESRRGEFLKQWPTGPAWGLIQMEEATHDDTWKHGDSIWKNAVKLGIITERDVHPHHSRLAWDLRYNVFMARQRLFMKPGALPSNLAILSHYLKKHWNSTHGSASDLSYMDDYLKW